MSNIIAIADAVVADLGAGGWTAERSYLPRRDLKELGELRITVVPAAEETEPLDRGSDLRRYTIHVALQKRLESTGAAEQTEIDSLMQGPVEQIKGYLNRRELAAVPGARVQGIRHDPIYAPDHLDEMRVLTSLLVVTIEEAKDVS